MHSMRLLVAIVQYGSFSKAAAQLNITATKASKDIRYLETSLNISLLHRTTRSLHLTDAGEIFYANALTTLENHQQTLDKILNLQASVHGELRISAPDLWGQVVLTPIILAFKQRYPDVSFQAHYSNQQIDLHKTAIHIAFRSTQLKDQPYIARLIHTDTFSLCASHHYLEQHPTVKSPADLVNHNFITLLDNNQPIDHVVFNYAGKEIHQPINSQLAFSNKKDIFSAAKRDFGVAVLPTYLIKDAIQKGDIEEILTNYPIKSANFYALYTQRRKESALIDTFIQFVIQQTNTGQNLR
jgi:DNA-binding transcriptional LysR family regulator